MKRDHHHIQSIPPAPAMAAGKMKMWDDDEQDSGMDELLAILGYKVKSSEMEEVAQKIEQLEEALGTVVHDDNSNYNSNLSNLVSDTVVHINPSDISNFLGNMLSEVNPNPNAAGPIDDPVIVFNRSSVIQAPAPIVYESYVSPAESSSINFANNYDDLCFDCDLKAIPGKAVFAQQKHESISNSVSNSNMYTNVKKKLKQTTEPWGIVSSSSNDASPSLVTRPVVLVDSQETGVRLVHTLMACGHAIQSNNLKLAETLVKQIGRLAPSQAGAMRKVATYFAEAIARKIYRYNPKENLDPSLLQMHFYESCPYLKFSHFTANQAILEAFSGKKRVHVIDFSMNQGMQWPALMQALALRPGGPPAFRLTGIGPPALDKTDRLQEVGWKLAQFAETIHVEFEYRGFVAKSLADLDSSMLDLRPSETESVAVNSVFELHRLLARPGAIEKVLNVVKEMKPVIVTIVEQEANHNSPIFSERFNESLHYYSTLFDSLEGSVTNEDKVMSEVYLGRQICNLVACEGLERFERHEPLTQWQNRFNAAGFESVYLGSNAFKQASLLLALFGGGNGYRVEEKDGCLMLCWHTRPLITTTAWQVYATQ